MADTHQSQEASKDASETPLYTLHYFPFSLYSLMARFSIVLGKTVSPDTAPNVAIKFVDLQKGGNLTEEYLTTVNSRGQVPALTSTSMPLAINESRDIANWLCEKQPDLLPTDYKDAIGRFMEKLFLYHAKALNIPANGITNQAAAMLENPNITTAHRRALEIKSIFHDTLHGRTVEPDNIELVERNTREFMAELAEQLGQRSGQDPVWIFGDAPTILDGYAMPFAKRLYDLERSDLLPDAVREWALKLNDTPEWQQVSHGRSTVYKESMGPAADLKPL